jgi:hypothetical protein
MVSPGYCSEIVPFYAGYSGAVNHLKLRTGARVILNELEIGKNKSPRMVRAVLPHMT